MPPRPGRKARKALRPNPELIIGFFLGILFLLAAGLWTSADFQSAVDKRNCEKEALASGKEAQSCRTLWQKTVRDPSGFFTFCLFIVGGGQAALFIWQLVLIRRSLADTKEAAEATRRQVKLARDSLIANSRAWLRVNEHIGDDPLTFDAVRISLPISMTLTNFGNAVSLSVSPDAEMHIKQTDAQLIAAWRGFVAARNARPLPYGFSVFPGDTYPPVAEDRRITVLPSVALFADAELSRAARTGPLQLFFFVAVRYCFPTDTDGMHQTAFMLHVNRRDGRPIMWSDEPIPSAELIISRSAAAQFYVMT